jgi:hypothetical protein
MTTSTSAEDAESITPNGVMTPTTDDFGDDVFIRKWSEIFAVL